MRLEVTGPRDNLIERVAAELIGDEQDYSSNLVVFPGRRPGHFLRRHLAHLTGRAFIPPTIFSIDDFIDYMFEDRMGCGQPRIETVDAIALLYEIQRRGDRPVAGEGFLTLDAFLPLALRLYDDLEECRIEMVDRGLLDTIGLLPEAIPPASRERLHSFSFFFDKFYEAVAARRLSTRSLRYRSVAAGLEEELLAPYSRIFLCGFFALTRSEQAIFKAMTNWGRTSLFFQQGPGVESVVRSLGLATGESTSPLPVIRIYRSPDRHGQVFGAAALLKKQLETLPAPDEGTVIVLPSAETLFPLLHHALPLFGTGDYNISLGYPLERTPIFGFLTSLMEMILTMDGERVYTPHYLSVMLHPYVKNLYFGNRSDVTRILFHGIEESLRSATGRTFPSLEEIEEDQGIYDRVMPALIEEAGTDEQAIKEFLRGIHDAVIKPFLAIESVGDFARKASGVIEYLARHSTARLHPFFHPFSGALVEELAILEHSLLRDMKFSEKTSYLSFFKGFIRSRYTPFEGTPLHGLQVLGFLETRNLAFRRVIFMDANEEVLPGGSYDDPFLPAKARKALGMPTYKEKDGVAAYYFETLIRGADEVDLFFVERDGKEKSRFVERLIWEMQRRDHNPSATPYVASISYGVNLGSTMPDPMEKGGEVMTRLGDFRFSAASLDTYLTCPLKFYYRYLLRLKERENLPGAMERDEIGSMVHAILYEFFQGKTGRPLSADDVNEDRMERVVSSLFEQDYGPEVTGRTYLVKRQCLRRMKEFLARYQLPLLQRENIVIRDLEMTLSCKLSGFNITGRLDRVEDRGKTLHVLDYKTGSSTQSLRFRLPAFDPDKRDLWPRLVGSLQLPVYLLLLAETGGLHPAHMRAAYLDLGRNRIDDGTEIFFCEKNQDPAERLDVAKQVILHLLGEITSPAITFIATSDPEKACPYCDFRYICGTQWTGPRP